MCQTWSNATARQASVSRTRNSAQAGGTRLQCQSKFHDNYRAIGCSRKIHSRGGQVCATTLFWSTHLASTSLCRQELPVLWTPCVVSRLPSLHTADLGELTAARDIRDCCMEDELDQYHWSPDQNDKYKNISDLHWQVSAAVVQLGCPSKWSNTQMAQHGHNSATALSQQRNTATQSRQHCRMHQSSFSATLQGKRVRPCTEPHKRRPCDQLAFLDGPGPSVTRIRAAIRAPGLGRASAPFSRLPNPKKQAWPECHHTIPYPAPIHKDCMGCCTGNSHACDMKSQPGMGQICVPRRLIESVRCRTRSGLNLWNKAA